MSGRRGIADEKIFLSNEEELALSLHNQIKCNKKLQNLEKNGFLRGVKRNKTMDVSTNIVFASLEKQWSDLTIAWKNYPPRIGLSLKFRPSSSAEMLQKIADLRNVAGCFFLKLTKEA